MYAQSKIALVSSGVVLFGVGVTIDFLPRETTRLIGAPAVPLWRAHGIGGLAVTAAAAVATAFTLAYAWLLFFADPVSQEARRAKQ